MANAHSWPAQVLIQIRNKDNFAFCGGTLIDFTTVLTAGKCQLTFYFNFSTFSLTHAVRSFLDFSSLYRTN